MIPVTHGCRKDVESYLCALPQWTSTSRMAPMIPLAASLDPALSFSPVALDTICYVAVIHEMHVKLHELSSALHSTSCYRKHLTLSNTPPLLNARP